MNRAIRRLTVVVLLGLTLMAASWTASAAPAENGSPAPTVKEESQDAPASSEGKPIATERPDFDAWLDTNLNDSLATLRGVYDNLFLVRPSIWHESQGWVIGGWSWLLLFGLPVACFAAVVQGVQVLRGEDSSFRELGRRLAIPIAAVVLMAFTPVIYETVRATQEYLWLMPAQNFDPKASTDVLAVALPQVGRVDGDLAPEPACKSAWWRCVATGTWEAMKRVPVLGKAAEFGESIVHAYNFVRGVRVRTGMFFSTWNVMNLIILGFTAFLVYLAGCFLVIVAGFYNGLAALARNLEPMIGWVDLIVRTVLMSSVFNASWLVMRGMPQWMKFAGLDAVFYSVIVLPLTLWLIYRLWFIRMGEVIGDPIMLGGAKVMGRWAGRLQLVGQLLATAGTVTGQPALAGAGSALSGWANNTANQAQRWEQTAREGGSKAVVSQLFENALRPAAPIQQGAPAGAPHNGGGTGGSATEPVAPGAAEAAGSGPSTAGGTPCWRDGDQFVIMQHGMPVHVQTPPDDADMRGNWTGKA